MKLIDPTDFELLAALQEHGRNTGKNLSVLLEKDRSYVNTRLSHLAGSGLATRIGPAENSGLYEITERGRIVVDHWETSGETNADFESLIHEQLSGDPVNG